MGGNAVAIRHAWRDDAEGRRCDRRSGNDFALDLRHVAGYAGAAGTFWFVMRVLLDGSFQVRRRPWRPGVAPRRT